MAKRASSSIRLVGVGNSRIVGGSGSRSVLSSSDLGLSAESTKRQKRERESVISESPSFRRRASSGLGCRRENNETHPPKNLWLWDSSPCLWSCPVSFSLNWSIPTEGREKRKRNGKGVSDGSFARSSTKSVSTHW